ncbi:MAG: hypoxanthine phosphoribosyltransferase [Anaerolineales bacterium]
MNSDIKPDIERVLLTKEEISLRVAELAQQISDDYRERGNLYLVGVLKGAFIFLADLVRELTIPHAVDFMAVSSYGNSATSSGAVRILMDLRAPIENRDILLVEDIVDTGQTISYLHKTLQGRRPASLKSCVLVQKERDVPQDPIDYLGFTIPDVWVVGYGLDYAETYRTLPYLAELKRSVYEKDG